MAEIACLPVIGSVPNPALGTLLTAVRANDLVNVLVKDLKNPAIGFVLLSLSFTESSIY